ncbi:MAG TPA: hypothetical protein VMT26_06840 [Candidatus Bathyarchaeia archaeon]|nr:hypothetical protein [Candidatus Bathyarchaeia archaeon]
MEDSPKSYYWTREEERKLVEYWRQGVRNPEVLADRLGRKLEGVKKKLSRLGLVVEPEKRGGPTTTELEMPEELPSVEEALKLLVAAMEALQKPGLSRAEVSRLRSIIQAVRTYKELFADYVDYRGIEAKLIELEAKYGKLVENQKKQE